MARPRSDIVQEVLTSTLTTEKAVDQGGEAPPAEKRRFELPKDPLNERTVVCYNIQKRRWLTDWGCECEGLSAYTLLQFFAEALLGVERKESLEEEWKRVQEYIKQGNCAPEDPIFYRTLYDPVLGHLRATRFLMLGFVWMSVDVQTAAAEPTVDIYRDVEAERTYIGGEGHGPETFAQLTKFLYRRFEDIRRLEEEPSGCGLLWSRRLHGAYIRLHLTNDPRDPQTRLIYSWIDVTQRINKRNQPDELIVAKLATDFGSQVASHLDAASSVEERNELEREVGAHLAGSLPAGFRKTLAEALARDGKPEMSEAPSLPSARKIVLTVEEMQQELDQRTGRSFGSVKANRAEINLIKGYLKASNLKLVYEGQDVIIRLSTPPRSKEGSFQLRTTGTEQKNVYSDPLWPPLTAAKRN